MSDECRVWTRVWEVVDERIFSRGITAHCIQLDVLLLYWWLSGEFVFHEDIYNVV